MGNEANCRKFCDHDTEHQKHQFSQIKVNQYPMQCQLCKKQVQSLKFKRHLDLCHLATIQERNQVISVYCLLCEKSTPSLQQHFQHFKEVHPLIKERIFSDDEKVGFTNKLLKQRIKQIQNKSEFCLVTNNNNKNQLKDKYRSQEYIYKNQIYNTLIEQRQYQGIQYDEDKMKGDLVWSPIFCIYREKARFFYIQISPLERSIHCKAYIFVQKNKR